MGLTTYEAKLYLALLQGADNPRDASIMSGVPLPRIYDVIKMLEVKGFVVQEPGGWYRPLPPKAVGASVLARIEEEARKQAGLVQRVITQMEKIAETKEFQAGITQLRGIYSLVSVAVEMAADSSKIYFTAFKAVKRARQLARSIASSLADVIPYKTTRILVREGASVPREDVELLSALGVEVRESPCIFTDMMITDRGLLLGFVVGEEVYGWRIPGKQVAEEVRRQLDVIWEKCSRELNIH